MSGESNQIVYEGPLSIESKGVFKKFKKYHCKLASTGITYYKAADDKESEGVVPFTKDTQISSMVKAKLTFRLDAGESKWNIQAEESNYQLWVDNITEVLKQVQFGDILASHKRAQSAVNTISPRGHNFITSSAPALNAHAHAHAPAPAPAPAPTPAPTNPNPLSESKQGNAPTSPRDSTDSQSSATSETAPDTPAAPSTGDEDALRASKPERPKIPPKIPARIGIVPKRPSGPSIVIPPPTNTSSPVSPRTRPDHIAPTPPFSGFATDRPLPVPGERPSSPEPPPKVSPRELPPIPTASPTAATSTPAAPEPTSPVTEKPELKSSPPKPDSTSRVLRATSVKEKTTSALKGPDSISRHGRAGSSVAATYGTARKEPGKDSAPAASADRKDSTGGVMKPEADRRTRIAQEILSTEQSYLQNLQMLVTCYQDPLRIAASAMNVKVEDINVLFPNCLDMVIKFNTELCSQLEQSVCKDKDINKIGAIFIKLIPFLKMYNEYSSDYQNALNQFNKLIRENPLFKPELDKCRAVSQSKLTFEDLIIMPVQRVPRYNLLLTDLLKNTDASHPDYKFLQDSLNQTMQVASSINESVRKSDNAKRIAALETKGANFDNLIVAHRYLVREGPVKVQENKDKQTQHFFLFNDILVHIRASMLKGGIDLSLPEFTWPLQLVWFREHEKEKVEVIGPSGSLLIKKTSETTQWIHDLREGSKNWCQRQNENDNSTANDDSKRKGKYTFPNGGTYEGEWLTGALHGTGVYTYFNIIYEGKWEKGKRHGDGKLTYSSGAVYDGNWKEDKQYGQGTLYEGKTIVYTGSWVDGNWHGKGVYSTRHNDTIDGDFVHGKVHGTATLSTVNGLSYTGEWKDDQFDGAGELTYPNKLYYKGTFKGGLKHGKGDLKYPSGAFYSGDWQDDLRHGNGLFKDSDGSTYEGEWDHDKFEGKGTRIYSDQTRYEGAWKGGLRKGQGTCIYKGGARYDGHWSDDRRHGNGTYMEIDGSTYVGEWANGHRDGKGVMTYVSGAKYDGTWANDKYHKNGSYFGAPTDSTKIYEGEWSQGRMHGKGSLTLQNGDVYKGSFKDGRFHGAGTYIYADGTSLTGKWTNGVKEGKVFLSLDKKDGLSGNCDHPNMISWSGPPYVLPPTPISIPVLHDVESSKSSL